MNKLILAALAASAALSTPALAANNDTGTVTVNGSVAGKCKFTTGTATINANELAGADGKLDASVLVNKTATLVGWCNQTASTMKVTAKPLLGDTAAPNASFTNRVDIDAQAVAAGQTATDSSVGETAPTYTAGTAATVGIFSGNVDVKITAASSASAILTAGTYVGTVDVTLTPAS